MDVKCCKCKKEYDLASNIFEYDKGNCPILICPYCGFKHIINFMPFEKRIKVKKIKKIDLGVTIVNLGASRIANATRVDQSHSDDASINTWEIGTAIYANKSKDVTNEETTPHGVFFKPDGSKMYVVGTSSRSVLQYALTVAWDSDTAVYENKATYVGGQGNYPQGIFFKPDGLSMYVVFNSYAPSVVCQYALTVAWDADTGTYTGKSIDVSAETEAKGLYFSPDGTKLYVIGTYPTDEVFQYTVTTAWDLDSASFSGKSMYVGDQEATAQGLFIRDDGKKMYVVGSATDSVYQYSITIAWDMDSASYDGRSLYVGNEDLLPYGIFISPDGTKMYMIGNTNDTVFQYDLASAWNKTNDFILATRIYTSKGPIARAYKLRWRDVTDEGVFADVLDTGEITSSAVTDLTDGGDLLLEEKLCDVQSGYTWQNGLESEGDNLLPDSGTYSLADEYYTEFQWALDCSNAEDEHVYEFELWDVTEGVSVGTCLASITMAITIITGLSMKWNGVAISKWNGAVINKLNGVD